MPPAQPGNLKALRHGAHSEAVIAPARARYVEELRAEFPEAHQTEIIAEASRLGRMELVYAWLDQEGVMHTNPKRKGDGWNILRLLGLWEGQSERWHERRREEAQAKRTEHGAAMRDVLARLEAEKETPQDAAVDDDEAEITEIPALGEGLMRSVRAPRELRHSAAPPAPMRLEYQLHQRRFLCSAPRDPDAPFDMVAVRGKRTAQRRVWFVKLAPVTAAGASRSGARAVKGERGALCRALACRVTCGPGGSQHGGGRLMPRRDHRPVTTRPLAPRSA